jgi:hypothetical protein
MCQYRSDEQKTKRGRRHVQRVVTGQVQIARIHLAKIPCQRRSRLVPSPPAIATADAAGGDLLVQPLAPPARSEALVTLLLAIPAFAVALLAAVALARTAPLAWISVSGALGLAGVLAWLALFVVPLSLRLSALATKRTAVLAQGQVVIARRSLLGRHSTTVPLAGYRGIAHVVRTASAGTLHELVLVHADPSLDVTLHRADRISAETLANALSQHRLREVPARDALQPGFVRRLRGATHMSPATTQPMPRAA